jgi:hypothetical protein
MASPMNGKLVLGTLAAIVGAVIGAIVWAAITASTNFQIGYMAVGVGFLAGYGMRIAGGGYRRAGGIVAGVVALLGCVLGNLLTSAVVIAQHDHYPIWAVALAVLTHAGFAGDILTHTFDLMDLVFYAIAIYAGYRTALKPRAPTTAAAAYEPPVRDEPVN